MDYKTMINSDKHSEQIIVSLKFHENTYTPF